MGRPFSERVAHDDWRHAAEHWICTELAARDVEVTGPVQQPRVRPWSTQLTVPTDTGMVWFKANCAYLAFEPPLQAELARLAPDAVDAPCAVDTERGWMLTRDRGATLGDTTDPTVDDWRSILSRSAQLQRTVAGHEPAMLATGLPDCRPATVVGRYDRLLDIFSALPDAHPAYVSGDLLAQLTSARGRVADAAAELEESSLPTTWQHGDLHPWNVFATDGRLFDFGDGQWAHAAEVLSVPHAWITRKDTIAWPAVLEACADAWGVTPADLASQQRAAALTQPVNRTVLWWGCLQEATAAEWTQWGDALLHHLTRVLEP
jgi:hypothetical protein